MIKLPIFFILMLFAFSPVFFLGSCTSEQLTPNCDTLNMSYANNVAPILKNYCYPCHSKGNTAGSNGQLLDNWADVSGAAFIILRDPTSPRSADSSYLVGNIKHLPPTSTLHFHSMPYMKPPLDACSINQIAAWVYQGAHDN